MPSSASSQRLLRDRSPSKAGTPSVAGLAQLARRPARPRVPARRVPVPAHVDSEARPHDEMRCSGPDLLITARAPIGLGGRGTSQPPYDPFLTARVDLDELEPTRESGVAVFISNYSGRRPADRSSAARAHRGTGRAMRSAPAYTFIDVPRRKPTNVMPTEAANSAARLDGADTAASTGMPAT
jgi:hypothetical protein